VARGPEPVVSAGRRDIEGYCRHRCAHACGPSSSYTRAPDGRLRGRAVARSDPNASSTSHRPTGPSGPRPRVLPVSSAGGVDHHVPLTRSCGSRGSSARARLSSCTVSVRQFASRRAADCCDDGGAAVSAKVTLHWMWSRGPVHQAGAEPASCAATRASASRICGEAARTSSPSGSCQYRALSTAAPNAVSMLTSSSGGTGRENTQRCDVCRRGCRHRGQSRTTDAVHYPRGAAAWIQFVRREHGGHAQLVTELPARFPWRQRGLQAQASSAWADQQRAHPDPSPSRQRRDDRQRPWGDRTHSAVADDRSATWAGGPRRLLRPHLHRPWAGPPGATEPSQTGP
jgi:hypothetical protein